MQKKLRVACLHGYGTNAKFLSRQMRSFKRSFDKQIQFVFLEGSFIAPKAFVLDQKVIALIEGETRCWNPLINYKFNQNQYVRMLLEGMEKYFKNQEYDGIIGFSQGAVMTHFLVKLEHFGKLDWKGIKSLKFCILVCGNHWNWDQMGFDNSQPIELPSIHLISESDFLYRKSIFTTTQFKDPLVIHHPFGHTFPRLGRDQFSIVREHIIKACRSQQQEKKQPALKSKL